MFRILVNVGVLGPFEARFPVDEQSTPPAAYPQAESLINSRQGYVASIDDGDAEAALLAVLQKDSCLGIPIVVDARVWGAIYATRSVGQPRFARGRPGLRVSRWPPRWPPAWCRPTTWRASSGSRSRTR